MLYIIKHTIGKNIVSKCKSNITIDRKPIYLVLANIDTAVIYIAA